MGFEVNGTRRHHHHPAGVEQVDSSETDGPTADIADVVAAAAVGHHRSSPGQPADVCPSVATASAPPSSRVLFDAFDTRLHLDEIPLSALRPRTRELLAAYLNRRKILPSENSYWRDWRGLFEVTHVSRVHYAAVEAHCNPTEQLLQRWQMELPRLATIGRLQQALLDIDRVDCLDDNRENFENDAKEYLRVKQKADPKQTTTGGTGNASPAHGPHAADAPKPPATDENFNEVKVLTHDDVERTLRGEAMQRYDALMIYAEEDDEDSAFAVRTLDELTIKRNLKICHSGSYLGGHQFEHVIQRELLADRCNRLIVLLSPAFIANAKYQFISNMAQSMGIVSNSRKLIPVVHKEFDIPPQYQHITMLNFCRPRRLTDFWQQLYESVVPLPLLAVVQPLRSPEAAQIPVITVSHVHVEATKPPPPASKSPRITDDADVEVSSARIYPPAPINRRNSQSMMNLSVTGEPIAANAANSISEEHMQQDSRSEKSSRSLKQRYKCLINKLTFKQSKQSSGSDSELCAAKSKSKSKKKMALFAS